MFTPVKIAVVAGGAAVLAASLLGSGGNARLLASLVHAAVPPPAQGQAPRQVRRTSAPAPSSEESSSFGAFEVPKQRDGHFHVDAEVEGQSVPMLVDTGASMVVLSYDDARDAGLDPAPADFTLAMQTANGLSHAAPVTISDMRVGPSIEMRDVRAAVAEPGALSGSLLGMSFLSRLKSFEVRDGRLLLKP